MKGCLPEARDRRLQSPALLRALPAARHKAASFLTASALSSGRQEWNWSKWGQSHVVLAGKAQNRNPGTIHCGKGEVKHLANRRRSRAQSSSSCLHNRAEQPGQEAVGRDMRVPGSGYCLGGKGGGKDDGRGSTARKDCREKTAHLGKR